MQLSRVLCPNRRVPGCYHAKTFSVISSATVNAYPRITCPAEGGTPYDHAMVSQAIADHIWYANEALACSQWKGTDFPPFKAIFKNEEFVEEIESLLWKIIQMGPVDGGERPEFICIRTALEAERYEARLPGLWHKCNDDSFVQSAGTTLFICPGFLLPNGALAPDHEACPDVEDNSFVARPSKRTLFNTNSTEITSYLLMLYGDFGILHLPSNYEEMLDAPLGWRAFVASRRFLSYDLYIECGYDFARGVDKC